MRVFAAAGAISPPARQPDFVSHRIWLVAADGRYHVGKDGKLYRQTMSPNSGCSVVAGADARLYADNSRWNKRTAAWRLPPSHVAVSTEIRTWKLDKGVKCEEERVICPTSGSRVSLVVPHAMKLDDVAVYVTRLSGGT